MKSATFETGLSDHHKITTSILRKTINKSNSRTFSTQITKLDTELKLKINSQTNLHYSIFQVVFLEILNKIAPVKQ